MQVQAGRQQRMSLVVPQANSPAMTSYSPWGQRSTRAPSVVNAVQRNSQLSMDLRTTVHSPVEALRKIKEAHELLQQDHSSLQIKHRSLLQQCDEQQKLLTEERGARERAEAKCIELEERVREVKLAWAESQDQMQEMCQHRQAAFDDSLRASLKKLRRASVAPAEPHRALSPPALSPPVLSPLGSPTGSRKRAGSVKALAELPPEDSDTTATMALENLALPLPPVLPPITITPPPEVEPVDKEEGGAGAGEVIEERTTPTMADDETPREPVQPAPGAPAEADEAAEVEEDEGIDATSDGKSRRSSRDTPAWDALWSQFSSQPFTPSGGATSVSPPRRRRPSRRPSDERSNASAWTPQHKAGGGGGGSLSGSSGSRVSREWAPLA